MLRGFFKRTLGKSAFDLSKDEDFVEVLYRVLLERPPDGEGKRHYLERLGSGSVTRSDIVKAFTGSDEYRAKSGYKCDPHKVLFDFVTVCPDDGFQPYVEDPPFDGARLCGLVDPRMWLDEEWRDILLDIKAIPPSLTFMHRKGFEWTHTIYGLRKLGALREDSKCLGVGSGHEALVYWLANNAGDVIATDLFEGEWAEKEGREGDPKTLLDPGKYAPFPYRKDRLRFMRMDGRKLEFENESFDIVLSMSSIEHFGGHENAAASMKEMGRVLRRGGVAAVVTEFVINGQRHPEFFDRDELIEHVVAPSGLKLVQAPEFRLPGHAIENPVLDPDERHMTPHLVLKVGKTLYTSVILFFRKPPE